MPRDTNPVVVVGENQEPLSTAPAQETGNTNPPPMLITPEVEPPHRPVGSGSSVVLEPEIGTPIVRDEPKPMTVSGIQAPTREDTPAKDNPIKSLVNSLSLPSFLGGGGGGGADASQQEETNAPKKPNYVLYGGILLAVILAYKFLSKKKK